MYNRSYFKKGEIFLQAIAYPYIVLFVFMLMPGINADAQVFKKEEAIVKNEDTGSVLELLKQGSSLTDKKPDEALELFVTAAERSKQLNFIKGLALSNAKMGRWYFGNNTDKSIDYCRLALSYYEKDNTASTEDKAEVHLLLAEAFDEQGRQDSSAYYYYLLSNEIEAGQISDALLAVDIYTKLAIFWINLDYGSSENDEYFKRLKSFVDKAKSAAVSIKDSADAVSSVYFLQGAYFHGIKNFDSARYYYTIYVDARERLNKLVLARKISTYANIADTYLQENKPAEAMKYINKVEELVNAPEKNKYLAFYLLFINLVKGKALYQQKQYYPAIDLISETLDKFKSTGAHLRAELVEAYKVMADSYEATSDYKKALEQKNIYIALHDSLMKKDKMDMINRLAMRYRMVEKDKELTEQKLQIAEFENSVRSRNYLIGAIASMAFFTALAFVLWRRKNIHKQKLQQERIDNLQQKMEIERLNATIDGEERERARIARELHDGVGALLTGAKMNFELVKKSNHYESNTDFTEGIKLLEETAAGLRETAQNIMPEILMQEGLTIAVKSFCERMTGKGGTIITFQTLGEEKEKNPGIDLPVYRIIQELIHNIRKHAKAATALVQMNYHDDGGLDITVEDDGIGIAENAQKNTSGMGLNNIKERVQQLGGRIDINSSPGKGTSVYLEFEFLKNNVV